MNVGLLWYDDGPDLAARVQRAAARYRRKFGAEPNTCYVHPAEHEAVDIDGITVRPRQTVLLQHLWMGVEQ